MEWVSIKSNYDEDGKRKSCNDNCVNGHNSTKKSRWNVLLSIKIIFLIKPQKLTKSSPSIRRLLSKCQIDVEDFFSGLLTVVIS